ncbi:GTPase obg [Metamycoplasma arthritidis]|uniref:GTPase Obg n=1 Tax=Metamycoplasma arthritidis (strain 158L3-1) TaxID=243272 RepID=OBG_META1|nr:GTPase ObgE [Metamycoplasma arthritidis]B3PMC1.1 RecName: Full=GTPase Obg; AltName: Full=GTP-binding protein Obg [Metamycoplasma arthritidis 158L3-1]ACF07173.1 GTPase protein Obg [Metamycoplasma arthritidis 158L3-1]VEU78697.1 GTPase obg [Metamycoplasma arthritidis]
MKFIDEVNVLVKAGKGGDGIISFRREANVDRGGPDGGNGGRGGNVYFRGDSGLNTLLAFHYQNKISAKDGESGKPKNAYGAAGADEIVKVPLGTLVYYEDNLIADVIEPKDYLIAKGGRGGRGNLMFKSAKNTAPRICENGESGEKFALRLVLKVLADVGLVGKPSAGKSSLLNALSNAKAKTADYDFTTLVPQLGMLKYYDKSCTIADLPGLIAQASEGKGLGFQFLKHIERCKVIAHVIDFGSSLKDPILDYETIKKELKDYNLNLEALPHVIIANKSDQEIFATNLKKFKKAYPTLPIVAISALYQKNLDELKAAIFKMLEQANQQTKSNVVENEIAINITLDRDALKIRKLSENVYEIESKKVLNVVEKIPVSSLDNLWRINNKLKKLGVFELIKKHNVPEGATIKIGNFEFDWSDEE